MTGAEGVGLEQTSARPPVNGPAGTSGRRALFSLMLASFAIGTGEFVIVGLVPALAADLRVSVPAAGLLISGYALSVAFGSRRRRAAARWPPASGS